MSTVVSNVLDLMRFESGQVRLQRRWETVEELVELAVQRVAPRLEGARVTIDVPAELPPVFVDGTLLTQALANLLDNAAKHTPPGTHVTVHARVLEGGTEIAVEDDGPGLPPGDTARLFAKFQRGRDESEVPGAGLGLAIFRAVVEAHGGRVSAANRPGGGARFVLYLPPAPGGA
jgi:two-component system sensor histidine kinase KdpD